MGAHAIGVNRAVPCVGSPDGPMFACGAEGAVSLVTLADAAMMADGAASEIVMVHVTVCPNHAREVRAWLKRMTDEPIESWSTAALLDNWAMLEESMQGTPIWRLQNVG